MRALFTSKNLIGDAMYISPALHQWHKEHSDASINLLTLKNHAFDLYSHMGVPMQVWLDKLSDAQFDFEHTFDVGKAFSLCDVKKIHVAEAYAQLLGVKLEERPFNGHLKPVFIPTPEELSEDEKGCILVSMFSNSCSSQERGPDGKLLGKPPNKMLPWGTWQVILRYLRTLDIPLRFIGGPNDRTMSLDISEEEYALGVPLNRTALMMQQARLVVTIDNGMSHMAASQETPTFLFYPVALGLHYILPKGNPNLVFMHMNPVEMHPVTVVTMMKRVLPTLLEKTRRVVSIEGVHID